MRVEPGAAVRIMTGAVVPDGADAVVRFEDTSEAVAEKATGKERGEVEVLHRATAGDNVRRAGEDLRKDEVVLARGTVLRAPEIGMLASVGRSKVLAHRRPRVAMRRHPDTARDRA
jgi:molybdopterin molybdotransferase